MRARGCLGLFGGIEVGGSAMNRIFKPNEKIFLKPLHYACVGLCVGGLLH